MAGKTAAERGNLPDDHPDARQSSPEARHITAGLSQRLQSFLVPMDDGVRLALDLWLPVEELAAGRRAGTALRATRYHRASVQGWVGPEGDANAAEADRWAAAGMALMVVDARGSGASFGTRDTELGQREIADYGELLDWITAQPWSNGRVGVYGNSYSGDAAELTCRLGNRHLTAVAPLFSDFDPYSQLVYPGGCYAQGAFGRWAGANQVLDGIDGSLDRLAAATGMPPEQLAEGFPAVKPVDGADGPGLLAQARAQHQGNADLAALAAGLENRDDRLGGVDWDTPSPSCWQAEIEASGVPMLVRVGWLDAGTAAGALQRFARFSNPQQVEIGPWSHGGDTAADPLQPDAPLDEEWSSPAGQQSRLVEFFVRHVQHGEPPKRKKTLRLATLGTAKWTTLTSWPPPDLQIRRLHLLSENRLGEPLPDDDAISSYAVEVDASSGEANRWIGNVLGRPVTYPDRRSADRLLLAHTGDALPAGLHLLGFPVATLRVATTGTDGSVHCYLEVVDPHGGVAYLTEGHLRFRHRATAGQPQPANLGVPRAYSRADARPVVPGEWMDLVVELLPISAFIPAGHRLRLALAGHDAACCARYGPSGECLTFLLGKASYVDLPHLTD